MKILFVLCRDPFEQRDGGTYAIRATLERVAARAVVTLTGFGPSFDQPSLGGYPTAGSLGLARNTVGGFLRSLASRYPYALAKYGSVAAQQRLLGIIGAADYDVVWYEQTQAAGAAYLSGEMRSRMRRCLHVLRHHNVEAELVRARSGWLARLAGPALRVEATKLRRAELAIVRAVDHVLTISGEDRDALNAGAPGASHVMHAPVPTPVVAPGDGRPWAERRTVAFVGISTWGPNAEAVRWIRETLARALERALPDIHVRLIGGGTEALQQGSPQNVSCAGFVPDLAAELRSVLCTLAPIRSGAGVNIKVIESLANGIPVVGTHFSRRGVDSDAYLEAETVVQFVERIRALRDRPQWAAELSRRGRESAERSCSQFEAVLDRVLSNHSSAKASL